MAGKILITPNAGSTTLDPTIAFQGAGVATDVTLRVPSTGGISFEGTAGQLFSITDSLSGTIFSVNDVSGIPSIEVIDTGLVKLAQYSGNVVLGSGTDDGVNKLQVNGSVVATNLSGTNTGDNATNTLYSGLVTNATHTGDVTGSVALTIASNAVTLAKMADVATGTVFYRKTAATGDPEVQTLATLKTDLLLTGTNSGDNAGVTSVGNGNGMNFTAFTTTGTVTLGTPSTLTAATTNALTTNSHTHAITGFLPLTGGTLTGTLNSSLTLVDELRTLNGNQLIINVGESNSVATGQAAEILYVNSEGGLEVNSSPDNWGSGWAGRRTASINDASGNSTFPGSVTATGAVSGSNLSGTNTGDNAGVTSVGNGNGMNFTTFTTTGTVTLGTPSTLTAATTNALTASSHTHEITGFLTAEVDTLATVTGRGNSTSLGIITNGYMSSESTRFLSPAGAAYNTSASAPVGAFRIKLPVNSRTWSAMFMFTVNIYNYTTGSTESYRIGGHQNGTNWYNISAHHISDVKAPYTVRFGYVGADACIWIGETNTTWSYPQVFVTDFQNGYGTINNNWGGAWTITVQTVFDTVQQTRTPYTSWNSGNLTNLNQRSNLAYRLSRC